MAGGRLRRAGALVGVRPGRGVQLGLATVLTVFGFLASTAYVQEQLRQAREPGRIRSLRALVERRRDSVRRLSSDVRQMSTTIERLQRRAARGSTEATDRIAAIGRLSGIAGSSAVTGPGVTVELADSDRVPESRGDVTDLRIQDADLRVVLNVLWRAGAEAMAVDGHRITSTTAVRKAGTAILVNFRAVSSPYRVEAIGDPSALVAGVATSGIARRFDVWREVYGLGFTLRRSGALRVPAISGLRGLEWAEPARAGG